MIKRSVIPKDKSVDLRSERERKAYAAAQAFNRQVYTELQEFTRMKEVLGRDMPYRSLASFRRAKRGESQSYVKVRELYRIRKARPTDEVERVMYKKMLGNKIPNTVDEYQAMKYNINKDCIKNIRNEYRELVSTMSFEKVLNDLGKQDTITVRRWYQAHLKNISAELNKNKPIKEQAIEAFEKRNMYKLQARELMADEETCAKLDLENLYVTFNKLFEKYKNRSLSDEETYKAIIEASMRTRKSIDEEIKKLEEDE